MEIWVSARDILGNKDDPRGMEEEAQVPTGRDVCSLVIDSLCDQAAGQGAAIVACFYFDFEVQKEQTPTGVLGSLLKQLVVGLGEIPEEVSQAYQDQQNAIGRWAPRLSDIVKMLQATSCTERTFICIDSLDECAEGHRIKLLDSLNQILQRSPGTRTFVTGRPHLRPEIGRRLAGRVTSKGIQSYQP
ncbi:hypothetical protein L873DRAFT_1787461 [Choiromyces venosus 120613-1]|uniref:Nephrocystin 3-like N-terminal domain-containing protein n=1 Tax=Choiromyces venosus 120613-1 TaxID=1336337 RepID=A0A3N4K0L2_9PEZI|nr:hypothetical protein L873DRAFT_57853 [Choiromyces venosus 120613-1]RPB02752.1 hypothetical protein L873DRAFT_1787461 [Choiromyces venosus 120613-1]